MRETGIEELIERDRQRDASSARQAENEMDTKGFCIKSMLCVHAWCMYICVCVFVIIFEGDRETGKEVQTER